MPEDLIEWVVERLDRSLRQITNASTAEGYVFNIDQSHGADEWMLTAKPKHGISGLPVRHFVIEFREMK